MDLIKKMSLIAKQASKLVCFDIVYVPGVTEEEDLFAAVNKALVITCYGPTEDQALTSARMEAEALFMGQISLAERIIKENHSSESSKTVSPSYSS